MKRHGRLFAAIAAVGIALIGIGVGSAAPPAGLTRAATPTLADGRLLDDRLRQLVDVSSSRTPGSTIIEARHSGLAVKAGKVRVVVSGAAAAAAVAASGGTVEAVADGLVQALVDPTALGALAESSGVSAVRPPASFRAAAVTGEGVATTGAAQFGSAGTGAGTTVAVIDLSFAGYSAAIAAGELPSDSAPIDHCGGSLASGNGHGTAVAEIIHDVAPGARLLLICIDTEVTLAQGLDDAIARGATIVNHSVQWYNTSRGDGSGGAGSPDATVARARANGIVWVNAAGNAARTHWSGTFVDANGNGRLDFAPGDEGNGMTAKAGATVCARLKWDEWPVATSDYDLYLERSSDGTVLASSTTPQATVRAAPAESACWTNTDPTDVTVDTVIKRVAGTALPRLDLFDDAQLQYQVAAQSIVEPASSPNAVAVGAVCWSGTEIEPYSSRGPTIDGRIKPDIVGPDAVSTTTFGASTSCSNGFTGTSASAPFIAGLLALRRSAQSGISSSALEASLALDAVDLGAAGKDTTTGAGLAWLPIPSPTPGQIAFAVAAVGSSDRDIVVASPTGGHPVRVTGSGSDDTDPAIDATGTRLAYTGTTVVGANIYRTMISGSSPTQLTSNPGADIEPAWSPDGTKIAFASERGGDFGIWVMKSDGTGQTRVTTGTARDPSWSTDGKRIVYSALSPTSGYDIWVVNADGSLPQQLTTAAGDETSPSWAPGGAIAYAAAGAIHTMTETGSGDTVSVSPDVNGAASDPVWSADGAGLVFVKGATLWRSAASGANPFRLTPPIGAQTPAWSGAAPPPPPAPPPSGGGGSGGGGGGGGGGAAPDVQLTNVPDRVTAGVGDTVLFRVVASLRTATPASRVVVTVELPANLELVSTKADRGPGCTGATPISCNLDFLSGSLVATVEIVARVTGNGAIAAVATAQTTPADADPANNVATARVQIPAPVLPPRRPSVRTGLTLEGSAKADTLRGTPYADVLRGFGGADRLFGLGGPDRLFGGPGRDFLSGGAGDDVIVSRDGARDTVDCGSGNDTVNADRFDRVSSNCETVRR